MIARAGGRPGVHLSGVRTRDAGMPQKNETRCVQLFKFKCRTCDETSNGFCIALVRVPPGCRYLVQFSTSAQPMQVLAGVAVDASFVLPSSFLPLCPSSL
eukprot:scaffold614901_cov14-Prasinocladus_malaysianus.AAC.1